MSNEFIKLYHGDCLDVMNSIPEHSVDLILCDLPYGTTACSWDVVIPFDLLWEHYNRISKPNAVIALTSAQPFTTQLISSNLSNFKYCWVWDKHIPRGFQTAKYRPMNRHEDVCIFTTGGGAPKCYNPQMVKRDKPVTVKNYSKKASSNDIGKYNDSNKKFTYTHRNPDTIIQGCWEANGGKVHPTQKPVSLMEYLIKTYTNEGELVLDNCMGSGSTGVAAVKNNRKFIGIELNEEYFTIASQRIKDAEVNIENLF
jgi:site-specific DNA-methyltransferase (adenine-specific)